MKNERRMTAFYLETVLMVIIFVLVILIMVRVLGIAKLQSARADQMTSAVCLAQNAAEAAASSDSEQELLKLLDENGNAALEKDGGTSFVTAGYDAQMRPDKSGPLKVEVSWDPAKSGSGTFITNDINVYYGGGSDPLYSLDAGVYLRDEAQGVPGEQEADR